ncbi:hypothetical protein [Calothrix sp. UHCC 0171]|uniref:hypothetical protein n=1 Tax=Calothrix sp. UHCC 0171 TaxID=3110245 RepID=UPI002B1F2876|nr:hypothetical protein [Calothrix sp. UHCC 0171]MEA5569440.1 hypothetical protein [Calothrix sp. UHCC 0171]
MFKSQLKWQQIGVGIVVALGLMASIAHAESSQNPQQPTVITSAQYSGKLTADKQGKSKKYYLTFLTGKGGFKIDSTISTNKEGVVFFWNAYKPDDLNQGKFLCNSQIYLDTKNSSTCNLYPDSQTNKPVILEVSAYANGNPITLNYTLNISGNWQPVTSSNTSITDNFVGNWVNINPNTNNITRLGINLNTAKQLKIRAFGKCQPKDCDWGEVSLTKDSNNSAYTVYKFKFANKTLKITLLAEDKLQVETSTVFTDNSGRKNYSSIEIFKLTKD